MTVRFLTGDVREMLATMPDESIDCVVTSPPYWGLRDYGVAGQLGLECTLGEHIVTMVAVMREVRRVMKPEATLWLNYGDCYATTPNGRSAADVKATGNDDRTFRDKPFSTIQGVMKPKDLCMVPNRLAIALQEDGWWVRSEIIWAKPNPMPESIKDRPATAHEKIFLLSKAQRCFYDSDAVKPKAAYADSGRTSATKEELSPDRKRNGRDGNAASFRAITERRNLRNYEPAPVQVWEIATKPFSEAHFATFPPELAERCIKAGCPVGGTVLDPFGGAGTTAMVADRLQRHAVLIELNPAYVEIARRRIANDAGLFAEVAI